MFSVQCTALPHILRQHMVPCLSFASRRLSRPPTSSNYALVGDGTLRFLGLSTPRTPTAVSAASMTLFGPSGTTSGAGNAIVSAVPSMTSPARAASMVWVASMACSISSSLIALTPPLCSIFISRGTSKAQIFMYAAGCCLRTFSIAAAPCFLKSAARASRKSLLNDLRVASEEPPGCAHGAQCWLLRLLVRVDHVAGPVFRRCEHGLIAHAAPGLEAGALLDVVILHLEEARLCPLPVRAVSPAAHDGLELVLAEIVRDLVVNGALGTTNRFAKHGDVGVAPSPEIVAERIGAFGRGACLVLLEELGSRRHHLFGRHPGLVVDDAVELGPELGLDRDSLQTHHPTAEHLRLQVQLVRGQHHADRAQRI